MKEFRAIPETNEEGLWSIVGQLLHETKGQIHNSLLLSIFSTIVCLAVFGSHAGGTFWLAVVSVQIVLAELDTPGSWS